MMLNMTLLSDTFILHFAAIETEFAQDYRACSAVFAFDLYA
jgi:hypothetical protein